jgi:hypothetical protein
VTKNIPREASLLRSAERILKEKKICFRKRHGGPHGAARDPDIYFCWRGAAPGGGTQKAGREADQAPGDSTPWMGGGGSLVRGVLLCR